MYYTILLTLTHSEAVRAPSTVSLEKIASKCLLTCGEVLLRLTGERHIGQLDDEDRYQVHLYHSFEIQLSTNREIRSVQELSARLRIACTAVNTNIICVWRGEKAFM